MYATHFHQLKKENKTMTKSKMELEDERIYNKLLAQGIPKRLLKKPNRRVVKLGNMEFDMNEMSDKDVDGYINAFSSSIQGIQRAMDYYNHKQEYDEDRERLFWEMDDTQKQMQAVVDGFKREKEYRKGIPGGVKSLAHKN